MSDIEKKGRSDLWGEDIFELATTRKNDDASVIESIEEAVINKYRRDLRSHFQNDPNVKESIPLDKPASECKEHVMDALKHICRPGTEGLFERVIEELLKEIDEFRLRPSSSYIVDDKTGRVLVPLSDNAVYTPPDFIGEDGLVHKARPIVHPSISSGLAMAEQERHRMKIAISKAKESGPLGILSLEHEKDPDSIRRVAVEILESKGFRVDSIPRGSGKEIVIEFGREAKDGGQAPNYSFHRFKMFGTILAKKIADSIEQGSTYDLDRPVLNTTSKQRWYTASVRTVLSS
jgi:hypothetical protein